MFGHDSPHSHLRVSDADRERTAERVRQAAGEGRLSFEELEGRLQATYTAVTYADLERITADLPLPPAPEVEVLEERGPKLPQIPYRRSLLELGVRWSLLSLACVAIFFGTGAHGFFWPALVIAFSIYHLLNVARRRRRRRQAVEQFYQAHAAVMGEVARPGGTRFSRRASWSAEWPFGTSGPFGSASGLFGPKGPFSGGSSGSDSV
jgi:hypothetical protein